MALKSSVLEEIFFNCILEDDYLEFKDIYRFCITTLNMAGLARLHKRKIISPIVYSTDDKQIHGSAMLNDNPISSGKFENLSQISMHSATKLAASDDVNTLNDMACNSKSLFIYLEKNNLKIDLSKSQFREITIFTRLGHKLECHVKYPLSLQKLSVNHGITVHGDISHPVKAIICVDETRGYSIITDASIKCLPACENNFNLMTSLNVSSKHIDMIQKLTVKLVSLSITVLDDEILPDNLFENQNQLDRLVISNVYVCPKVSHIETLSILYVNVLFQDNLFKMPECPPALKMLNISANNDDSFLNAILDNPRNSVIIDNLPETLVNIVSTAHILSKNHKKYYLPNLTQLHLIEDHPLDLLRSFDNLPKLHTLEVCPYTKRKFGAAPRIIQDEYNNTILMTTIGTIAPNLISLYFVHNLECVPCHILPPQIRYLHILEDNRTWHKIKSGSDNKLISIECNSDEDEIEVDFLKCTEKVVKVVEWTDSKGNIANQIIN